MPLRWSYRSILVTAAFTFGCGKPAPPTAPPEPTLAAQVATVLRGDDDRVIVTQAVVRDADLESIRFLPLTKLVLDRAEISNEGLAQLKSLTTLEQLRIRGGRVGDAGVEHLLGLGELRVLNLPLSEISDQGLCALAALPKLELLRIGSPNVTDKGLACLANFPSLRFLHLIDVPITDQGLKQLHGLRQLESFYLDGSRVTDDGIERLLTALPNLHFHRDQKHSDRDPHRHDHQD